MGVPIHDRQLVQEKLKAQLRDLDRALILINVSDLHAENVVFQIQKIQRDYTVKIILIDLENIQKESRSTQLFGDEPPDLDKPSAEISRLANNFNREMQANGTCRSLIAFSSNLLLLLT